MRARFANRFADQSRHQPHHDHHRQQLDESLGDNDQRGEGEGCRQGQCQCQWHHDEHERDRDRYDGQKLSQGSADLKHRCWVTTARVSGSRSSSTNANSEPTSRATDRRVRARSILPSPPLR